MGAARESDQADFDLERFIDMFDTAMTSNDPRVVETLRKLMMIVALTAPESSKQHGQRQGPLRRMFEDMHHLNQRMSRMDEDIRGIMNNMRRSGREPWDWNDKYTMAASQNMAQSIDRDIINQFTAKINGGPIKGSK